MRWQQLRSRQGAISAALGVAVVLLSTPAADATAGQVDEIQLPTPMSGPSGVAAGPHGSIWFTESDSAKIGVVRRDGSIREFALPSGSGPSQIVKGPDRAMWFTEFNANQIGRITPNGRVTSYPIPTNGSGPFGITVGSDGNLWFTEETGLNVARITPAGDITEFPTTDGALLGAITSGPDGALWFTEETLPESLAPGYIDRITTSGSLTQRESLGIHDPFGIAAGPDGNLWVTGATNDAVARVSTAFRITTFTVPGKNTTVPWLITSGPDGAMWFTDNGLSDIGGNTIVRVTVDGAFSHFRVPTHLSKPAGIAAGPGRTIWFAEQAGNRLGRITA